MTKRVNFFENAARLMTIALCVTLVLSSCDDKEEPKTDIKVENETALTQTVYADETDGKSGVTFITTGAWTSTITEGTVKSTKAGTATQISIDPDHGNDAGEYTITISLEPNATGEDRSATITITCNNFDITITVSQKGTKENGEPYVQMKLPETVTYTTGNYDKYVYDEQNRIKTIVSYNQEGIIANTETFTYNGNDLVKREAEGLTMEFTKTETGITIKRSWTNGIVVISTLDLDSNGLPVEHKESDDEHGFAIVTSYQIYGGNLINLSIKQKFDDGTILEHNNTTYKYGTDKSPFYHCETPKWFLFWFSNFTGSQNNIIEQTWGENKGKYEYIFDNAGFPVVSLNNCYNSSGFL